MAEAQADAASAKFPHVLLLCYTSAWVLVARWCSRDCCRDRITRLALHLLLLEGKVPEFTAQEAGHFNT
jgi:hypothetical protein